MLSLVVTVVVLSELGCIFHTELVIGHLKWNILEWIFLSVIQLLVFSVHTYEILSIPHIVFIT